MQWNLKGGQLGQNGPKGEGSTLIPRARTTLALEENERWFLVHTQPYSERKAELHLGAQGFRAFLPQIQKTIRHARQLRTVRAPLFPRYMFLILDLGRDRWLSVRSTVGVSSLFTCEDRPVPVPNGVVEELIARTNEAGLTVKPASLVRAMSSSTTPLGTGTGRSSQVNSEETPTVLRTDSHRSRPRSRMRNM